MLSECTVDVSPGVCKLHSVITATMDEEGNVVFKGTSDCPHVRDLIEKVGAIVPWTEMATPINQTKVYTTAGSCLPHAACPVPCSMVKAAEAASGLGLKRDVEIKIS